MCRHESLPTNKHLVTCPDCGAYFAVRESYNIAASRGGLVGHVFEFLSSNALGHYTNEEYFTRKR